MRKPLAISGVLLVLVLALSALFDAAAFAAERLTRIAENVYAYVGTTNSSKDNSFGANSGIIIGRDGIVVVDTLLSAKEARRFLRDIRSVSDKPIRYVVNTHYHLDHVFGNCEFARLGAVIIAQENDRKAMEKSAEKTLARIGEYGLSAEEMQGTTPAYPELTYGDRMTIDLGDQRIELIHARPSHTDGDTLVYLPDKRILFTGDILFTGYHPFLGEGNIPEWAKELEEIKLLDVEKIIPGHGPLSGKKDLEDMRAYILLFDQKAKELASKSSDVQEIVTAIRQVLPPRPEGAWLIEPNIRTKYLKKP
ncbi:Glyoxylase, beta-lactamase superfamily II [Syntrophus gentianae]|uniref:Glyoxylase, beta-lactamase superfamily II n=1 Tax=Syntrophus gentianae TaxID=43775 RepID=A0A1H8AJY3_9BACT|nr:MBL fold metallo-hydrolase [Syntrophus gentianae]SEM70304.1 Glyoxylase, beta-lactamase superfamily II [Syntrophus gentianae]